MSDQSISPSSPVLVFCHAPHETLGTLATHLAEAGLGTEIVELYRQPPERLDLAGMAALVIMGGPMNVDEVDRYPFLAPEIRWIRTAVELGKPVLGICLGAQLLAKALGARVRPNGVKEIGWYPLELIAGAADDPLLAGCGPRETVFQWHGDTFDLPESAVLLGRSRQCVNQAFRYGPRAYGLQFHIEMTPELVERWLTEPGNQAELAALDYIDPDAIRRDAPRQLPDMERFGRQVLGRFVALARSGL